MADFIGKRHLKKNIIPPGAFVIYHAGEFFNGCSMPDSNSSVQCDIENRILKITALESSNTHYTVLIPQSPLSGTGKTPNIFAVDIATPTPDIIDSIGVVLYGETHAYMPAAPWSTPRLYQYNVASGNASFEVALHFYVASGQSATAGQTLLGIRSIWYE